jgi:hypothetical protein
VRFDASLKICAKNRCRFVDLPFNLCLTILFITTDLTFDATSPGITIGRDKNVSGLFAGLTKFGDDTKEPELIELALLVSRKHFTLTRVSVLIYCSFVIVFVSFLPLLSMLTSVCEYQRLFEFVVIQSFRKAIRLQNDYVSC